LEALLARLVAELEEASAAFKRLLRDVEWVAITTGGGVNDDVEAMKRVAADGGSQEPRSRLSVAGRLVGVRRLVADAGRTISVRA
jgi:hypothetical protein